MTPMTALWLPILLSAVFVFIASAIIHMLPLWHRNDYPAVPNQDQVMGALRPFAIPPGDYMLPRAANMKEYGTPEFKEKIQRGPVAIVTVIRGESMSMARSLIGWFLFSLAVSYFAAYIASRALAPGANYLEVFRFAGATAFIGYTVAQWHMSIWYHRAWKYTITETFDGLIYALLTAGTFGWLWPK
jgi:hypothetical protein